LGQPDLSWNVQANRWIVAETVSMFTPQRCMFASNFPVDGLCGDMTTIFDGFKSIVSELPESSQAALFHDTAFATYRPVLTDHHAPARA
jgi:predicted TIM-barrel fold metal-dependent hydrolase